MEFEEEAPLESAEDGKERTKIFIQNLTAENFDSVDFNETLNVTLVKTGETIGTFNISVKRIDETINDSTQAFLFKFEITAKCSGDVEQQISCSFTANAQVVYADGSLQVLSQTHNEFVKCGELRVNKVTETRLQDDGSLIINRKINEENEPDIILTPEESKMYLSDGASLLLMRILAKMDWNQQLEFITLDGDGQICPVIYYPAGTMFLYGNAAVKIGRELHRDGKIDQWMFTLFRNGELYSWIHKNSPVYMEYQKRNDGNVKEINDMSAIGLEQILGEGGNSNRIAEGIFIDNPMAVRMSNFKEDHQLSTIDEEEHLSVSQNCAEQPQGVTGIAISGLDVFANQTDEEPPIIEANTNGKVLWATQSVSSGSTLHLRGLFDSNEATNRAIDANVKETNLNEPTREQSFSSGSTLHLRGLFESADNFSKNQQNKNEEATAEPDGSNPYEPMREQSFSSGSTMHLKGLFESINSNESATPLVEKNVSNESISSGSGRLTKGLFASYKNDIESRKSSATFHEDENLKLLTSSGLRDSGLGWKDKEDENDDSTEENTPRVLGELKDEIETGKPDETQTDDSTLDENVHVYEKFVSEKFLTEQELQNAIRDVPVNDTPNPPSYSSYLYSKINLLGNFEHPSPIPEEEESEEKSERQNIPENVEEPSEVIAEPAELDNVDQNPTNMKEVDEGNQVVQDNDQPTNVDSENKNESRGRKGSFKFPLEMFDTSIKPTLDVIGRNNSLPKELEITNSPPDSGRNSLSRSSGMFPPIVSPRGDKRMAKLMSRRLSALMAALDKSIGEESSETNEPKPNITEKVDSKSNNNPVDGWKTKLEHQSDFNSFNRFMVLSREGSSLSPRNGLHLNKIDENQVEEANDGNGKCSAEEMEAQAEEDNEMKNKDDVDQLNDSQTTIENLGRDLKPATSPDEGMGSSDMSALSEGRKTPPLLPSFDSYNDVQKFVKSECESYLEAHPEIRKILGDFLQSLLIARPDNILPFAEVYFHFVANRNNNNNNE